MDDENDGNLPAPIRKRSEGDQALEASGQSRAVGKRSAFDFLTRSPGGWVHGIAWHPTKPWLAAAQGNAVVIWEADSGAVVRVLEGHTDALTAVAWIIGADGEAIASSSLDRTVRICNSKDGRLLESVPAGPPGHRDAVTTIAWHPRFARLATGGRDRTARFWDAVARSAGPVLDGHENWVTAVAWHPGELHVATACWDGTVRVFDVSGPKAVLKAMEGNPAPATSISWSGDGNRLVFAAGPAVRVWTLRPRKSIRSIDGSFGHALAVAWEPGTDRIAIGSSDGAICLGHADSRKPLVGRPQESGAVTAVTWHPKGGQIAFVMGARTIGIWNPDSNELPRVLAGYSGSVMSMDWKASRLISVSKDGLIRQWDLDSGKMLGRPLDPNPSRPTAVAWNSARGAAAFGAYDGSIGVWRPGGDRPPETLSGHTVRVTCLAWDPAANRVAAGFADGRVLVQQPGSSGKPAILELPSGSVTSLSWSPNSRRIALADGEHTVYVWNPDGGDLVPLRHSARVRSAAWNPKLDRIATGYDDGTILIRTPGPKGAKNSPIVLGGRFGPVTALAWSDDGKRLAAATRDGGITVWDVPSQKFVLSLEEERSDSNGERSDWVNVIHWRDGRIAAGFSAGTIKVWNAAAGELLATIYALGAAEWITFTKTGYYIASPGAKRRIDQFYANEDRRLPVTLFPRDNPNEAEVAKALRAGRETGAAESPAVEYRPRLPKPRNRLGDGK